MGEAAEMYPEGWEEGLVSSPDLGFIGELGQTLADDENDDEDDEEGEVLTAKLEMNSKYGTTL